jgi:hypothetical protein
MLMKAITLDRHVKRLNHLNWREEDPICRLWSICWNKCSLESVIRAAEITSVEVAEARIDTSCQQSMYRRRRSEWAKLERYSAIRGSGPGALIEASQLCQELSTDRLGAWVPVPRLEPIVGDSICVSPPEVFRKFGERKSGDGTGLCQAMAGK